MQLYTAIPVLAVRTFIFRAGCNARRVQGPTVTRQERRRLGRASGGGSGGEGETEGGGEREAEDAPPEEGLPGGEAGQLVNAPLNKLFLKRRNLPQRKQRKIQVLRVDPSAASMNIITSFQCIAGASPCTIAFITCGMAST